LDVLRAMGVRLDLGSDHVIVHPADALRPVRFIVASHGVYSDAQPLLALLACHAAGRSEIEETVWTSRYGYADGFRALGASLRIAGATLVIDGPCIPGRPDQVVEAPDLRAAAALLLAALGVSGDTEIRGAHHLDRGYERFLPQLRALGASVEIVPR
jgi:UDP-N-acetylglucosamine 1-carboxyvinyltransferase